jgi:hypothetical protein
MKSPVIKLMSPARLLISTDRGSCRACARTAMVKFGARRHLINSSGRCSCRPRLSGSNTIQWPAPRRRTDRPWRGNRRPLHPNRRGAPSAHAHGAAWDIWLVARGTITALPFRCAVMRLEPRSLRRMRQAMWKQFWLQPVCRPAPNPPAEQYAPIPLQPSLHHLTRAQSMIVRMVVRLLLVFVIPGAR